MTGLLELMSVRLNFMIMCFVINKAFDRMYSYGQVVAS